MVALQQDGNVLITGVTGLIGGEIYRRLAYPVRRGAIWPLIRPTDGMGPEARLRDRMGRSGDSRVAPDNVTVLSGDILQKDWGLGPEDLDAVRRRVDVIVHNAADTSFAAKRHPARTNV